MLEQILRYKDNPKEDFPDISDFVWDSKFEVFRGKEEYLIAYQEERVSLSAKNTWYTEEVWVVDNAYPFYTKYEDGSIAKGWAKRDFYLDLSSFESKGSIGYGTVIYWEKMP